MAPAAMLAGAGVTATEESVFAAAVTVSAACALKPFAEAVMVVVPAATALASPAALMVATAVLDDVQVTPDVNGPVVPLLYVAVTLNCCVAPAARVVVAGATAMAVIVAVAAVTVSVFVALTPFIAAVMVVLPALAPVATPPVLTAATAEFDEAQVTEEVMFALLPSL